MKVLLIGGTGRLSKDTTELCLKKGFEVYLINRGNRNTIKDEHVHYLIGDIYNLESASEAIGNETFDVVVDYLVYSLETLEKRVALFENKTKQYVFISSATVYPIQEAVISEKSMIGNDGWEYAKEKRLCEEFLWKNKEKFRFYFTIVRPYITYDKRRIPFPVISKNSSWNLLYRIENNLPVIVPGDGNQLVTLTSTKDFAVGITGLLMNPQAFNNDFNITGDTVATWNEVIHAVENAIGIDAKVVYADPKMLAKAIPSFAQELLYDKAYGHRFDNSKLKDAVPKFSTKIGLYQGMEETVSYLLNNSNEQIIDEYWNSMENVVCNRFSSEKVNVSIKDCVRYIKAQNVIFRTVRKIKRK